MKAEIEPPISQHTQHELRNGKHDFGELAVERGGVSGGICMERESLCKR